MEIAMKFRQWMFAAAACVALAAQAAPKTQWTVVDLGPSFNPIFGGVVATALNDRGQVTGWSYYGNNVNFPARRAFIWDNGVLTDTGAVPGSTDSAAFAINSKGALSGYGSNLAAVYQ